MGIRTVVLGGILIWSGLGVLRYADNRSAVAISPAPVAPPQRIPASVRLKLQSIASRSRPRQPLEERLYRISAQNTDEIDLAELRAVMEERRAAIAEKVDRQFPILLKEYSSEHSDVKYRRADMAFLQPLFQAGRCWHFEVALNGLDAVERLRATLSFAISRIGKPDQWASDFFMTFRFGNGEYFGREAKFRFDSGEEKFAIWEFGGDLFSEKYSFVKMKIPKSASEILELSGLNNDTLKWEPFSTSSLVRRKSLLESQPERIAELTDPSGVERPYWDTCAVGAE